MAVIYSTFSQNLPVNKKFPVNKYNFLFLSLHQPPRKQNFTRSFEINELSELLTPLVCSTCKESFSTNLSFALHSINHNALYVCHMCEVSLKFKFQTEAHIRRHEQCPKYKCLSCDKSFYLKSSFQDHENQHKGIRHPCEQCGKIFNTSKSINNHRRKVHEKPSVEFPCEECTRTYRSANSLRNHVKIHHRKIDTSALCHVCGKKCHNRDKLRNHMKNHTGEGLYVCSVCSQTLTTRSNLETHLRVHSNEKPFVCQCCGKGFKQSAPYHYHVLRSLNCGKKMS